MMRADGARLLEQQRSQETTTFRKQGHLDISQGPRGNRRCTDIPICCLLALVWTGFIALGVTGFMKGDPQLLTRFIRGSDFQGNECGESSNADFPLTYFTVKLDASGVESTPSPAPKDLKPVCTTVCPRGAQVQQREDAVCSPEMYKLGYCSWYGGNTVRVADFCLDPDVFDVQSQHWQVQLKNIQAAAWVLVCMLPVALIAGYTFLFLVRHCTALCVWGVLLGLTLFFGLSGYSVFANSDELAKKHDIQPDQLRWVAYGLWAVGVVVLLFSVCMCRTIKICVALLKTASMFLKDVKSQIVQPLVFGLAHLVFYASWVVVAVYVVSIGMKSDGTDAVCIKAGDPYCVKWTNNVHLAAMIYLFVVLYWTASWLHAASQCATAYSVGVWYFAPVMDGRKTLPGGNRVCHLRLLCRSICLAVFYHGGSLALGALILPVVQLLKMLLFWVVKKEEAGNNPLMTILACLTSCFVGCMERFLEFISPQAYVQVALCGKGFCESAGIAFALFARHPVRFGVVRKVSIVIDFVGVMAITAATTFIAYLCLVHLPEHLVPHMTSPIGPLVVVAVGSCLIGAAIMHPFSTAANAVMHCFAADEEMELNAGTMGAQHTPEPLLQFLQEHCGHVSPRVIEGVTLC